MSYTNGYNITKVLPALFGRLAWSDSTLNTANKTSKSGRKFDDGSFHALVTVPYIKELAAAGTTDYDAYFTGKQNEVISRALNSVFNQPEFKEQAKIYERDTEVETLLQNSGQAIGYRIDVAKQFDISEQINSLELYFNGEATFNVYLFKQGSIVPLQTKSVTTVANEKTVVALTDWIMNFRESSKYYVVYFQDDLGDVEAIQEQVCWTKTLLFGANSFRTQTTGTNFNRSEISLVWEPNGINLQISSFRDFTENVLNQPHLFDELQGLIMAYQTVEEIMYSTRSNATERITKDQIDRLGLMQELTGSSGAPDAPKVIGLRQRIEKEVCRVREAFYPKVRAQSINLAKC